MIFFIIFLAGAFLRFFCLGAPSLGVDEALSLLEAGKPLGQMIAFMRVYDAGHPFLYQSFLHFWQLAGQSEFWLRSLSAVFGLLNLGWLFLWGRRFLSPRAAFFALLLAVGCSWVILREQEARMYAQLTFFLVGYLYCFYRSQKEGGVFWLLSGIFGVAALYTHYNAILGLAVPWVFLIFKSDKKLWGKFFALQLFMALAFLPQLATLRYSLGKGGAQLMNEAIYYKPFFFRLLELFSYLNFGGVVSLSPWLKLLIFLLGGVLAYYGWRRILQREPALYLAGFLLVPIGLALVVQLTTPLVIFTAKHAYFLYFPYFLLLGSALAGLWERRPRFLAVLLLVLFLLPQLYSWSRYSFNPFYQTPDWRSIARSVEEKAQKGDAIIIFPHYHSLVYHYYARRDNPVYLFKRENPAPQLDYLAKNHSRIWLLLTQEQEADPGDEVYQAFNRRFSRIYEKIYPNVAFFDRVRVYLFARK